jgi:ankyrin repeat protein
VNARDSTYGDTPLIVASHRGHVQVVSELLEREADSEANDKAGWTPLLWASLHGHVLVVKELLEYGAEARTSGVAGSAIACTRYGTTST